MQGRTEREGRFWSKRACRLDALAGTRPLLSAVLWIALAIGGPVIMSTCVTALASEPIDAGYRDFSFPSGTGGNNRPTGEKPESKLWWNDGFWWGVLWSTAGGAYHIHYLDLTVQEWVDTGVAIDNRPDSRADVFWDGEYLYVASHIFTTSGEPAPAGQRGELYRFAYDLDTMTYALDPDFPVEINGVTSETLVIEGDSTLQLWVTYVEQGKVMVNHTRNGDDRDWATPFVLPVDGAGAVASDDVSSIIAFDGHVGVLWSNQNSQLRMYFAVHEDGRPPDEWEGGVAYSTTADDHINLATLGYDVAGKVFAIIKTAGSGAGIVLLACEVIPNRCRSEADWTAYTVYPGEYSPTRPIVVIDEDNRELYVFTRHREGGQSSVYYKRTSIDNIAFPPGAGVPFIKSSSDDTINDPTSTKQNLDTTTGLVVLASDESSKHYFHNYLDLAAGNATTTTSISGTTSTIATTSTIVTTSTTASVTTSTTLAGVCGDHQVNQPTEECDGSDDDACPGSCLVDCHCGVVDVRVAASSDDAEERASGTVDLTSSDLELIYDKEDQTVGMRFTGVMIPQGAAVERAYLQFQVDEASVVYTHLTVFGEAAGNARAFRSVNYDISSRTPTTAEVPWPSVTEWPVVGAAGLAQRSPDIAAVIQEIVARADWAEGNGLVIMITGSGKRVAEAYDGDARGAPLLHVEYSVGATTSSTVTTSTTAAPTTTTSTSTSTTSTTRPTTTSTSTTTATTVRPTTTSTTLTTTTTAPPTTTTAPPTTTTSRPPTTSTTTTTAAPPTTTTSTAQPVTTTTVLPPGSAMVQVRVAASADDAEERASGRVGLTSSDLELIYDKEDQTVGMRFTGVMVPRGAAVDRAYVQFRVDEASLVSTDLRIVGEAAGDAPAFSSQDNNISSRIPTSAEVWWPGVVEWPLVGVAGTAQRSPDIGTVIQEIVDRSDWVAGNGLVIMVTGGGKRVAESYDGDHNGAPLLHVEYGGTGGASSTITTSTSTTTSTTRQGVCGDHRLDQPYEECDGTEDGACPGLCLSNCQCGLVNVRVAASSDDAEERASGRVDLTSSDLELVYDKDDQKVGMRFAAVSIPPGAVIELAYLQFQVDETSLLRTDLTILGEAAGDASSFSSRNNDISLRIPTSAEVWWPGVVEWPLVGESGVEQRSPDISAVIQEIVDRADWAEGNGLVVIITGSGKRVAKSYDGDPAGAPLLHVEYNTGN